MGFTVKELKFRFVPEAGQSIELFDYHTGAHFRQDEEGNVLLGGDPWPGTWTDVMRMRVVEFSFHGNILEATIQ